MITLLLVSSLAIYRFPALSSFPEVHPKLAQTLRINEADECPMDHMFDVGTRVWFPCREKGWIPSQVIGRRVAKDKIELQFEMQNGEQKTLQMTQSELESSNHSTLPQLMNPPGLDTSEDLSKLLHLNEPSGWSYRTHGLRSFQLTNCSTSGH